MVDLNFRENVVRICSLPLEATPDRSSPVEGGGDGVGTAHGSESLEVLFRNECREVAGLTHWGAYSYGRWWKGLALQYTIPTRTEVRCHTLFAPHQTPLHRTPHASQHRPHRPHTTQTTHHTTAPPHHNAGELV